VPRVPDLSSVLKRVVKVHSLSISAILHVESSEGRLFGTVTIHHRDGLLRFKSIQPHGRAGEIARFVLECKRSIT
jgi:hypothetical protein